MGDFWKHVAAPGAYSKSRRLDSANQRLSYLLKIKQREKGMIAKNGNRTSGRRSA